MSEKLTAGNIQTALNKALIEIQKGPAPDMMLISYKQVLRRWTLRRLRVRLFGKKLGMPGAYLWRQRVWFLEELLVGDAEEASDE